MHSVRQLIPEAESDLARDHIRAIGSPAPSLTAKPSSVASWYTQGTSDGLGDRLLMFDNTAAASLELLRFRSELAAAPGFECAVRESVERLAFFKHAAFAQARAVEYLDNGDGLALVSTHTPGKRLSDLFQGRQPRGGMHPAFVTWLVRQLAPALADFHAHRPGIAHGALTSERIVLTPDGRVVIVEHVLGTSLAQLQLSPTRLWRDLGVVSVPGFDGVGRLNGLADVVQLALMALSVLLGRRVTPDDYASRLGALLDEFAEAAGRRSPALVPPLRLWLERALQIHDRRFASSLEAYHGLEELPAAAGHQVFDPSDAQPRALAPAMETLMNDSRRGTAPTTTLIDTKETDRAHERADLQPHAVEFPAVLDSSDPEDAWDLGAPVEPAAAPLSRFTTVAPIWEPPTAGAGPQVPAPAVARVVTVRSLAIVCAVAALAEGAVIAALLMRADTAPPVVAPTTIPITIDSPSAGDVVLVDGQRVGVTPFRFDVDSSTRSIQVQSLDRLQASATPPATPPRSTPIETADARTANVIAAAAARQRSGGLRLSAPFEIQVLKGDRVLGSSVDGPIVTTAGRQELDFVNNALGYRARQTVDIKAGEIVGLTVKPPDGRVSINAQPWAQVWIDGRLVGETPLANIEVPIGEHEIVFRHPQLGEKRETAVVRANAGLRLSATMGR